MTFYWVYNVSEASKLEGISFPFEVFFKDNFTSELLAKFQGTTFQEFFKLLFLSIGTYKIWFSADVSKFQNFKGKFSQKESVWQLS